jgi:hypothetical protein
MLIVEGLGSPLATGPVPTGLELHCKKRSQARHWWLTPIILATREAKIKRIMFGGQPWQIVHETLSHTKRKG